MPNRIQLRRTAGWRLPAGARVVTRSTPFGNPFVHPHVPGAAVSEYRAWITGDHGYEDTYRIGARTFSRIWVAAHLEELRGRDLACFCDLLAACHADVLLDLANREAS